MATLKSSGCCNNIGTGTCLGYGNNWILWVGIAIVVLLCFCCCSFWGNRNCGFGLGNFC